MIIIIISDFNLFQISSSLFFLQKRTKISLNFFFFETNGFVQRCFSITISSVCRGERGKGERGGKGKGKGKGKLCFNFVLKRHRKMNNKHVHISSIFDQKRQYLDTFFFIFSHNGSMEGGGEGVGGGGRGGGTVCD